VGPSLPSSASLVSPFLLTRNSPDLTVLEEEEEAGKGKLITLLFAAGGENAANFLTFYAPARRAKPAL